MRVGGGVQGAVIAAQLLAPASTASGRPPAAAGSFAVRDSVTLSPQAKTIAERIARLAGQIDAGKDVTGKGDRADAATASGMGTADQLRMGQDGHAKIIESMEDTVACHKQNLQFAREVVKKYEETGETWSFQRAGSFKIDVESWGFKSAKVITHPPCAGGGSLVRFGRAPGRA